MPLSCPSENHLLTFLNGQLETHDITSIERHVDECSHCLETIFKIRSLSLEHPINPIHSSFTEHIINPGTHLGRFTILEKVGQGGMGVVYAAYDANLDRRVAIKMLRDPCFSKHILDEAKIVARLNHPCVHAIYDMGEYLGKTFLVMEFINGKTLDVWLAEQKRSAQEVIAIFLQIADGLHAAHSAGIIHGDFKPKNIMIDSHHQAHLIDFGLSKKFTLSQISYKGISFIQGTPAFMAPEQVQGAPVSYKSDQFSFCLTLFQSLFGQMLFACGSLEKRQQEIKEFTQKKQLINSSFLKKRTSLNILKTLQKGLSFDPLDRFSNMHQLAISLKYNPVQTWTKRIICLTLAFSGIGIGLFLNQIRVNKKNQCIHGEEQLSEIWNDQVKQILATPFFNSNQASVIFAWFEFVHFMDGHQKEFGQAYNEICAATHIRKEQSMILLESKMDCLELKKQEIKQVLTLLHRDFSLLLNATSKPQLLSPIEHCLVNINSAMFIAQINPVDDLNEFEINKRHLLIQALAYKDLGMISSMHELLISYQEEFLKHGKTFIDAQLLGLIGYSWIQKKQEKSALTFYQQAIYITESMAHDWMTIFYSLDLAQIYKVLGQDKESTMVIKHIDALIQKNHFKGLYLCPVS